MAYRGSWPTFRRSDGGTMYIGVKVMQYFLKHDGFLNDKADGYFGANTLAAVKAAQRHYGLVVDGVCGPNTWNKIVYLVSRSTYSSKKNISLAAKYVLSARYGYRVLDYNNYVYDTQTEACVADFQRKSGVINISGITSGVVGHTTWRYLVGSDKDLSLGKGFGGGSGSSSSGDDSSGGGSGGDKTYLPYPATAVGMADYAYSRIGDYIGDFVGFPGIDHSPGHGSQWCAPFIEYCASKVGYKSGIAAITLTSENLGTQAHRDYYMTKGFTAFINDVQYFTSGYGKHWGIIWSKNYTNITTIEANSSYKNRKEYVQKVGYYWDTYTGTYRRDDRIGNNYIKKFVKHY